MRRRIITMLLALCTALTVIAVPAAAADKYTITFDPGEGKVSTKSKTLTQYQTYGTLPTPTWTNHIFLGWFDEDGDGAQIESNTVFPLRRDQTLYAHWTEQYTITFDPNGGALSGSSTIKTNKDGRLSSQPSTPVRTGYKFLGWFTKPGTGGEPITATTDFSQYDIKNYVMVVYAHWEKGQYEITFDANGGVFLPGGTTTMKTWVDGVLSVQPFTPTRAGYDFLGWYTEASGGTAVTSGTVFSGPATVYAHWREEFPTETGDTEYTVRFDPSGGRLMNESDETAYTTGGKLTALPTVYARVGYTFEGWYTAASGGARVTTGTVFTGNVTVYAHWTVSPYTITFNPNGGRLYDWTSSLKTGAGYTLRKFPDDPIRDGYRFDGWYTAASGGTRAFSVYDEEHPETHEDVKTVIRATMFNTNTTLYAHWIPQVCTVTFNANGGTLTGGATSVKTRADGTLPAGALDHEPYRVASGNTTYRFDDWYTASSGGVKVTADTVFTVSTTIYAHWIKVGQDEEDKAYDITFNPNGGLPSASIVIKTYKTDNDKGKLTSLPTPPTRYGYEFKGWYTATSGGVKIDESTVFTAKTTVYARWTAISYTVTFNPNGGTLPAGGNTAATGEGGKITSTPFDPSRTGYLFNGWYTAPSGGARITPDTAFTANTTVYAHWVTRSAAGTGAPYIISFDPGSGTLTSGYSPMTTDASGRLTWLPGASSAEGAFAGWYNGESRVTTDTVFTGDATLHASWSASGGGGSSDAASDSGEYRISTPDYISGGAMEIRPSGDVRAGRTVTVDITTGSGYELTSLTVTDSSGKKISAPRVSSSRYEFVMPSANVTVTPVFSKVGGGSDNRSYSFNDVRPGDYCYSAVQWAVENGIAYSYGSANTFAPSVGATRGEVVAFLWRAAGAPEPSGTYNPFKDISENSPYYKAVLWAREKGITTGYNSTTIFSPNSVVTRAEAVTFLHRGAGTPPAGGGNSFRDVPARQYYADAVNWAVARGITNGYNSTDTFAPNVSVSRGEMVTFLYRAQG